MKHRIASNGLGANAQVYLNNTGELNALYVDALLDSFFPDGFDFQTNDDMVSVGVEPTYQYDDLKIITITRNKDHSTYKTGKAWGAYGSNIAIRVRKYGDYKRASKFTRFVDMWHPVLFPQS